MTRTATSNPTPYFELHQRKKYVSKMWRLFSEVCTYLSKLTAGTSGETSRKPRAVKRVYFEPAAEHKVLDLSQNRLYITNQVLST